MIASRPIGKNIWTTSLNPILPMPMIVLGCTKHAQNLDSIRPVPLIPIVPTPMVITMWIETSNFANKPLVSIPMMFRPQFNPHYGGWDLSPSSEAMESSNASSGPHLLSSNGDEQRIMFVNGDVDPWSELAVSDGTRVPGSSHHFWTHKIKHSDGDAIAAARQEIYDTISSWLGVEPSSLTAVE